MMARASPEPKVAALADGLRAAILPKCQESIATKEQFFRDNAERILIHVNRGEEDVI
jgi:hypothetical protein